MDGHFGPKIPEGASVSAECREPITNGIAQLSIDEQKSAQHERPQKRSHSDQHRVLQEREGLRAKLQDFAPLDHSGED